MAKRAPEAQTETIDQSLLEKVLATSEAQSLIDSKVARRIAVDAKTAVRYIPIGGTQEIEVSLESLNRLVTPTAKGRRPSRLILEEYLETCAQLRLNPKTKDVYLIGYDTEKSESGAMWSVVTSYHVLIKRADKHPYYDNFEAGLIVDDEGEFVHLDGSLRKPHQKIVGAWCKVYRKDRTRPTYATVDIKERDKGRGEWLNQKAWMIQKCAISAAMRWAFPNDCGSIVTEDEIELSEVIENTVVRDREAIEAERKAEANAPAKTTAEALSRRAVADDTIGKFKGELTMELRRVSTPEDVQRIREAFTARAAGEVDKLEFCNVSCNNRLIAMEANSRSKATRPKDESPPQPPSPAETEEEHGDAWEGEEDLAAIEEQIARES